MLAAKIMTDGHLCAAWTLLEIVMAATCFRRSWQAFSVWAAHNCDSLRALQDGLDHHNEKRLWVTLLRSSAVILVLLTSASLQSSVSEPMSKNSDVSSGRGILEEVNSNRKMMSGRQSWWVGMSFIAIQWVLPSDSIHMQQDGSACQSWQTHVQCKQIV